MKKKKIILFFVLILASGFLAIFIKINLGNKKSILTTERLTKLNSEFSNKDTNRISEINTSDENNGRNNERGSKYIIHKNIFTTMFWVGEKATGANDYIPNETSAWDKDWLENFGGIDNPYSRNGFFPKDFIPKENPFYFALPYDEFGEFGKKQSANSVPWFSNPEQSALKNKWIKITYKGNVCYAQWEDVGPFEIDDYDYVFLGKKPKEERAGLDISPATRTCLKMAVNDFVDWQFVDENQVPDGPWKETITATGVNW